MKDLTKYQGIIPAFYACYNDDGSISPERTRALTQLMIDKGVKGLYVCGSSGECIYQGKEERKITLENVKLPDSKTTKQRESSPLLLTLLAIILLTVWSWLLMQKAWV